MGDGVDYIERAREVAPLLAEASDEIETRRELPARVVKALKDRGLFRLLLPRSLGGAELSPPVYVQVLEVLGAADGSTAWSIGQNSGCSMAAPYLEPGAAREVFGGPDGILAWGPDLPGTGKGVVVEGGIRVSGRWGFASGSRHATWLGAHLPLYEADGTTPRLTAKGAQAVRTALFPRAEARLIDDWQVMGLRGTGSDSYAVKDLLVPMRYTLSRDNAKERRETGLLYRFLSSMMYASGFAGVSLGMARGALDAFIVLARDKIPRAARNTLRENNVIQAEVAQAQAKLGSARAYLLETLERLVRIAGTQAAEFTLEQQAEIRLAATWAINQAAEVVIAMYRASGSTAIFDRQPFERRLRDMLSGSQQSQGRPIHFETVGQILMGLAPQSRMFR